MIACWSWPARNPCPHPAQRRGDPLHRPWGQGFVPGEDELALLARDDPGEEPHEGASVRTVDAAGPQTAQADAVHDELVVRDVLDLHAESPHSVHGGLRVA